VVEEFLDGEEASFFALVNGEESIALATAQVCFLCLTSRTWPDKTPASTPVGASRIDMRNTDCPLHIHTSCVIIRIKHMHDACVRVHMLPFVLGFVRIDLRNWQRIESYHVRSCPGPQSHF